MATAISYIWKFFDMIFSVYYTASIIQVLQLYAAGEQSFKEPLTIDRIVTLIGSIAGIIYFGFRTHAFYWKSRIERDHLREDLKEKRRKNKAHEKKEEHEKNSSI